jgi:hypothetical protein
MDLKSTFTNPWVIGGGLALGAFLLLSKGSAAPANNGAAYASAFASSNAAAAANYAVSTNARVALGTKAYDANASLFNGFASLVANMNNVAGQVRLGQAQTNAGFFSSVVSNDAALASSIATVNARTQQTGIGVVSQTIVSAVNARASQDAAKSASAANMWASIAGSAASVVNTAIKAAA